MLMSQHPRKGKIITVIIIISSSLLFITIIRSFSAENVDNGNEFKHEVQPNDLTMKFLCPQGGNNTNFY